MHKQNKYPSLHNTQMSKQNISNVIMSNAAKKCISEWVSALITAGTAHVNTTHRAKQHQTHHVTAKILDTEMASTYTNKLLLTTSKQSIQRHIFLH